MEEGMISKPNFKALLWGLSLMAAATTLCAADYPASPIRIVVPYPAGGPTDSTARAIGPKLVAALGQPVVIDNRGGAGSIIGSDIVAKAAPDGHTILLFTAANTMNVSLMRNLPYDMVKDFAPITMLVSLPSIVVVHPSIPVKSMKEFIAFAKARPGQLSYASAGHGTPMHLAGELLKTMAGLDLVHVPYKGSSPALVDLIAGEVQVSLIGAGPGVLSNMQSGRLRALAVTNAKRSALFPELPTVGEAGLVGFESEGWHGLAAPARTPKVVINRLYREIEAILRSPDTKSILQRNGAEPVEMSPDAFAVKIRHEIDKWAKVVKLAKMQVD
jgi:tripartite-type tricarboxylate transporter receptor subunit TctC